MKIADLLNRKKNAKVLVRIPAKRVDEFGGAEEIVGKVEGVRAKGGVTWVNVKLPRKGVHAFRPQDISLV